MQEAASNSTRQQPGVQAVGALLGREPPSYSTALAARREAQDKPDQPASALAELGARQSASAALSAPEDTLRHVLHHAQEPVEGLRRSNPCAPLVVVHADQAQPFTIFNAGVSSAAASGGAAMQLGFTPLENGDTRTQVRPLANIVCHKTRL